MTLRRPLARMGICRTTDRMVQRAADPGFPDLVTVGRDDLID